MPYYDIVRIKAEQSDEEQDEEVQAMYDYLSPFLPVLVGTQQITREQVTSRVYGRVICVHWSIWSSKKPGIARIRHKLPL